MMRSTLLLAAAAGILLPAVLLVNAQEPSCGNARTALQGVGGTATGQIFTALLPLAGSTCQLGTTCCSLDAETTFKQATVEGYKTKVSSKLSQGLGVCGEHSMFDAMSTFIDENKNQLVGDIRRFYGIYFRRFETLFDRFFHYLGQSVHSGNSTELPEEFNQVFFEVFLASFLSHPNAPRNIPSTSSEFRTCFYNIYWNLNGHLISDWLRGFERSWNITMRYFRALRAMERVVDGILSQQSLTEQCQVSLMRMTKCARCAGLADSTLSCNGMCLNTLRGCLLDLGDLVEPIQAFSQALVGMKDRVLTFNPFNQVTLLQAHIFSFISSSGGHFYAAITQINNQCPLPPSGRRKREAGEEVVIRRSARAAITMPLDALNDSAHCLLHNMGLFSHLPDTLCDGEGVSSGNENCWNGRQLGRYSRTVVEYNRRLQVDNPEVLVCPQVRSRFTAEIRILRYMTRELNALTGMCSGDDEDCLMVTPTTLYYDLDAITNSREVTATPSSDDGADTSGSGSDENTCRPPSPTVKATTAAATDPTTTMATPTTATPTTREATTAAPTTREATTAAPTTREATTAAPTTREATTAAPTTREATTAAPTTREATTAAPTTREATTATPTTRATTVAPTTATPTTRVTTPAIPPVSAGPTVVVVESTGTVQTVSEPGIPVDGTDIPVVIGNTGSVGVPGEIAGEQGSGDGSINGSGGLLPSPLTLCVGLALTALLLSMATPTHSH